MICSNNVNIDKILPLPSPSVLKAGLPISEQQAANVLNDRKTVEDILSGRSDKIMIIAGPCSIHNNDEAIEYAGRLKKLAEKVQDKIFIIMRVYFEKPRTTVGWKGLIYDPDINDSYNIKKGLLTARQLLLEIIASGMPVGTEMLDPIIPQYIADTVTWAAIGARTTESQTHRQMASGLSMPVGFKNATDGTVQAALDAIKAASAHHSFIGLTEDGQAGIFRTKGNAFGHIVLRGGDRMPNFAAEHIAFTKVAMQRQGLEQNIIIDCSHANSNKKFELQSVAFRDAVDQIIAGDSSIKGMMLESNICEGNQKISENLQSGVSITDACIGWEETEQLINAAYKKLKTLKTH
jgi:3-deoxy-7-phosphoheptulonate synthase